MRLIFTGETLKNSHPEWCCSLLFVPWVEICRFYNVDLKYVIELGEFEVLVGVSSLDILAKGEFTVAGEVTDISQQKVYLSGIKLSSK